MFERPFDRERLSYSQSKSRQTIRRDQVAKSRLLGHQIFQVGRRKAVWSLIRRIVATPRLSSQARDLASPSPEDAVAAWSSLLAPDATQHLKVLEWMRQQTRRYCLKSLRDRLGRLRRVVVSREATGVLARILTLELSLGTTSLGSKFPVLGRRGLASGQSRPLRLRVDGRVQDDLRETIRIPEFDSVALAVSSESASPANPKRSDSARLEKRSK